MIRLILTIIFPLKVIKIFTITKQPKLINKRQAQILLKLLRPKKTIFKIKQMGKELIFRWHCK